MEWKEINKKAQELAYEFLKKMSNPHAEDFNPETTKCGIECGTSMYFEEIPEDYMEDVLIKGIQIRILTLPKRKENDTKEKTE